MHRHDKKVQRSVLLIDSIDPSGQINLLGHEEDFHLQHEQTNDVGCHLWLQIPGLAQRDKVLIQEQSPVRAFGVIVGRPCLNVK